MKTFNRIPLFISCLMLAALACSLPGAGLAPTQPPVLPATDAPVVATATQQIDVAPTNTLEPSPTPEPPTATPIPHSLIPPDNVEDAEKVVNDAVSVDTAAEKRAPYGDLYKYNWFERPFTQDMTYIADMDIASYSLSYDEKFFYVSIKTVGVNPNNEIGINFGVEFDTNADGFGDYVLIAQPEYEVNWSALNLQLVEDTNRDTGGLSAELSDAPLPGNGYDKVIFDLANGIGNDFDLAWVRINAGRNATIQFAIKRNFIGEKFLYGVISDAGLKSVADLDYVDRYTEEEAGSPEKSEKYYPIKAIYAFDNVCRSAFGISNTSGEEPQRCKPTK